MFLKMLIIRYRLTKIEAASPKLWRNFFIADKRLYDGTSGAFRSGNMLYGVRAVPNATLESLSLRVDPKAVMVLEKS